MLLDHASRWENQNGRMERILTPPTPESVRAIRELVAAAVGLVPSRGDQLVIESLPFESTLTSLPPAVRQPAPVTSTPPSGPTGGFALPVTDWRLWAAVAMATLFIAGAAVYAWKRRRSKKRIAAQLQQRPTIAGQPSQAGIEGGEAPALAVGETYATRALAQAQDKVTQTARIETLVEELRKSIDEDPALAASVLRSWIEEPEV